jgi:hypothetical protein
MLPGLLLRCMLFSCRHDTRATAVRLDCSEFNAMQDMLNSQLAPAACVWLLLHCIHTTCARASVYTVLLPVVSPCLMAASFSCIRFLLAAILASL